MKITFERIGHANNSSSTHSLIFSKKFPNKDTTDTISNSFGRNRFICATKQAKIGYAAHILKYSLFVESDPFVLYQISSIGEHDDIEFYKKLHKFQKRFQEVEKDLFYEYVKHYFSWMDIENSFFDYDGYIDHQSLVSLPNKRTHKNRLHIEFANKFLNFFVEENFFVLGGNDNEEISPPQQHVKELPEEIRDFINLWYFLTDVAPYKVLCHKDPLTEEFVLCKNGHLIKIKF